jgi:DNA-binding NarL/FixJ family response regulator
MANILIIEDEDLYRDFLRKIISNKYTCDTAKNGEEAKEFLSTHSYDVVLYDLRLPGISGKDLIHYVKTEIDPDIINIVITGYEDDWSPVEATEENIFFYLKKGYFHPADLIKIIESALQLRNYRLNERDYIKKLISTEKIITAGKLATGIAHEINNPLQSMVLIIELLKNKVSVLRNADDLFEDLALMEKGIERIQGVVQQLIELYRIDTNPTNIGYLDEIIRKAESFLSPIAREQNAHIYCDQLDDFDWTITVENQFFYVLINTCLSFLDFNHETLFITPEIADDNAQVRIRAVRRIGEEEETKFPQFEDNFNLDHLLKQFNGRIDFTQTESEDIATITIPAREHSEKEWITN